VATDKRKVEERVVKKRGVARRPAAPPGAAGRRRAGTRVGRWLQVHLVPMPVQRNMEAAFAALSASASAGRRLPAGSRG